MALSAYEVAVAFSAGGCHLLAVGPDYSEKNVNVIVAYINSNLR